MWTNDDDDDDDDVDVVADDEVEAEDDTGMVGVAATSRESVKGLSLWLLLLLSDWEAVS